MGYRIAIGNAVPRTYTDEEDREDKKECGYSDLMVEIITLPDAPSFLGSDRSNTRSHSGRNWGNFADRVGLTDYFEDRETGLSACPMLRPITQDEVDMLHRQMRISFPLSHVDEWEYGQLEWFIWWMRWAITNCENPSIEVD